MTTSLAPHVVAELDLTIEHFNANHADTVLFVARHAGARPDAADAELLAADSSGIDLHVLSGDVASRLRVGFSTAATTADDVRAAVLGTVADARVAAGDDVPLTSLERELATNRQLPTLVTAVAEARTLTPNLREIVLEGGLEGFRSVGGDQFVYLMVPRRGGPGVPADHTMAAQRSGDADSTPHGAYYTVREWDPDAGRITLWAVLHGHEVGVGGWAARCEAGERVAIWGPRHGFGAQQGARTHLFVVDESGFAATLALIDELPDDADIRVIAETVDDEHHVEFGGQRTQVTWLHRGSDASGTGTRLLDALRQTVSELGGLDGVVAFGAAESRQVRAIREYVRHDLGMPAAAVSVTGYWRRAPSS